MKIQYVDEVNEEVKRKVNLISVKIDEDKMLEKLMNLQDEDICSEKVSKLLDEFKNDIVNVVKMYFNNVEETSVSVLYDLVITSLSVNNNVLIFAIKEWNYGCGTKISQIYSKENFELVIYVEV